MGNVKIPVVVAATAWLASGLAVLGYTYIAFKETATDLEGGALTVASPLVASASVLAAETEPGKAQKIFNSLTRVSGKNLTAPFKPLERNKFKASK